MAPVRGASLVRNVLDLSQPPAGTTALIARYTLLAAVAVSCYFLGAGVALIIKLAPVQAATVIVAVVAGCALNLLEED
ncbi:MAG TPA: hypothetical protein PKK10_05465 [Woeseiaceae bacterium]|nr:hypothetical protein [Woeseiaceae bacterium]